LAHQTLVGPRRDILVKIFAETDKIIVFRKKNHKKVSTFKDFIKKFSFDEFFEKAAQNTQTKIVLKS
jgi:hypothetical protein